VPPVIPIHCRDADTANGDCGPIAGKVKAGIESSVLCSLKFLDKNGPVAVIQNYRIWSWGVCFLLVLVIVVTKRKKK